LWQAVIEAQNVEYHISLLPVGAHYCVAGPAMKAPSLLVANQIPDFDKNNGCLVDHFVLDGLLP
jgi:hypothetical protein